MIIFSFFSIKENIFFNVSSPIQTVSYSGIIFEKTEGGWIVNGYDDVHPYFRIYKSIPNQADPTLSVGGVSATFVNWTEDQLYNNGAIAQYRSMFYRAKLTHTSTDKFETDNSLFSMPLTYSDPKKIKAILILFCA